MGNRATARPHATLPALALALILLPALAGAAQAASPPDIWITSPAPQAMVLVNDCTVRVEGGVGPTAQRVFLGAAPVDLVGSRFSTTVTLAEGPNTLEFTAVDGLGLRGTAWAVATCDTTPPTLEVLSPAPFAVLPDDRATVFGVAERGATVTVAGVPVSVHPFDGTFLAPAVELAPTAQGCIQPADIVVVAVDRAGNRATVVRPVHADQCVEHPELTVALPTLTVAAGQATSYVDLAAYFTDDGGAEALAFSTQATGSAVGALAASYATRTLTLTWFDPAFRGDAVFLVVAHDRQGLTSSPAPIHVLVGDGPAPPPIELVTPASAPRLPAGGSVAFTVEARTGAGGPAALEVLDVPPGLDASARLAAGPAPGTYTVTVAAQASLATGTPLALVLLSHGPAGEVATATLRVPVYDATGDLGLAVESPSPPEVARTVQGPGGAYGTWVEVSSARSLAHLYTEEPIPGRMAAQAQALNAERTYFRFFAVLPSSPGVATVRLWVEDPGLPPVAAHVAINVLPTFGPPQVERLFLSAGGPDPTDARPFSVDWQGYVPDPDRTTYAWKVDGVVVSRQRQLIGVQLPAGVHAVTLDVVAPDGSTSATTAITVRSAPAPPAPGGGPLAAWPWILLGGFALFGLVMAGTEIGAYFLVVSILGALIDRQSREKLLAHFVRGRIYQIIQYEPGIHLSQLQRKAGVARGVCAYHLHALEKAGLIKTSRDGMYLRFTATRVPVDTETYALTEDERELLHAVQESPGITERELVASLGRSAPAVARSTKKLSQSGYLESQRSGGEVVWYPRTLTPTPAGDPAKP